MEEVMGRARYGVPDEIKDTMESFYRAVTKKSLKGVGDQWAHEPYAAVAGRSSELQHGWPAVEAYWRRRFTELGPITVKARLTRPVVRAVGDVAWVSGTEIRTITEGDEQRQEHLRMTAVLERRNTNWVIVSYHASEAAIQSEQHALAS
jgi:ketosteroid isomerase-like protein